MNAHSASDRALEIGRSGLQPLGEWMRTLVDYVRSGKPDLTNRQMALMMTVYIGSGPHTVRGLAEALHVSKPVITRALNKLSALGYLRRERDAADRRNIFITRTPKGAEFLDAFHHFIAGTARDERHEHPHAERTA
ncbi:MarR family transcriptional regulator [Sphingobium rhizovicinum]|jgi:DNA-binding MarR family transcriptional regulator|uniref:MarR family transcriptional regulator n=1 Tax=Sphingobium rhizovicinum TaxID=432308 RepID=A0ABV7NDQ8_9SPHN